MVYERRGTLIVLATLFCGITIEGGMAAVPDKVLQSDARYARAAQL